MQLAKLLAVAGVVAVVGASYWFGWDLARAGTTTFWVLMIAPHVLLAIAGGWRLHRDGELRELMRPNWGDFTRGFMGALAVFAAAYAFSKLVTPVGSPRESWLARIYLQLGHPGALRTHVALVAIAIIIAAAAEEIVWRGYVSQLLAEQFGSRRAWIFSAIAYALANVPTVYALRDPVAGWNPVLVFASLGAGLVWGGMTRMFGRLPPAIVSHALFDWVVVMMFRLWGTSI